MAQLNTLLVKGVTRLLQKLYATDIDATGNIDAATFNGFTLNDSVPSGAKFTDTTYEKVNKIADGLVPKLPDETDITKYLRQDGTWAVPDNPHATDESVHINEEQKTQLNDAYAHSQGSHAPTSAQENVIERIKLNGVTINPVNKEIDIRIQTESKEIIENGTYLPSAGKFFNSVIVNVPSESGSTPVLQSKTVTPSATEQVVTADEGYDALESVTVQGDSNLDGQNILEGHSIFGVDGEVVVQKYYVLQEVPSDLSDYSNGDLILISEGGV